MRRLATSEEGAGLLRLGIYLVTSTSLPSLVIGNMAQNTARDGTAKTDRHSIPDEAANRRKLHFVARRLEAVGVGGWPVRGCFLLKQGLPRL